ncbi:SpoIID/LytB domain-containing protein [Thermosynechococcus sp. HN-54]|uniref:SpoIID/LytB domain-containing protein n=1 Tax=Thermosynechococcus sp. HN-54 TaxID=2933959 RepID=UPI00202CF7B1|nr:SpoIID/LytB domain-containing protein [Thermosynechococcus sp. HN-54]URR34854.1 SpoIID/LytB domain-containing protein [Thermosynechococcus sp. HN-54]
MLYLIVRWRLLSQSVGLGCLISLLLQLTAAAVELRVAVLERVRQVTISSSTPGQLRDEAGRVLTLAPQQSVTAVFTGVGLQAGGLRGRQIVLEPRNNGLVRVGDRWYRGRLQLVSTSEGIIAINLVDVEDYLPSVVGKEMYPSWPLEALKAQAVASRSFVLFRRDRERRRPGSLFDVGATVTHQVYPGVSSETANTLAAVDATRGQVLTYNGQIIEAVFHASSGGHTENAEHVWQNPVPYLRGTPDFDQVSPNFQWTVRFTAAQLQQRLPGIGTIVGFRPLQLTPQGRVMAVEVVGTAGSRTISGSELRRVLGLHSTLLTITPEYGNVASQTGQSVPVAFTITGRGHGHGLGMSQWGAYGMALQGYTYDQILGHYYQGVTLSVLDTTQR